MGVADAQLPSGTVTFLFTDLERSTLLWEEHEVDMVSALARHDVLVRVSIESHRGYVFSTAGDAFGAAFTNAEDALESAVDAQRALRAERWPGAVVLRARMGLHSGVTHERDGNYFGPAVNRAARLMSAAHGGQVLASATTVGLLAAGHRFELGDLGRHRLPDLLDPEHLFHVFIDGDRDDYPPPVTLDAVEHNLPVMRSTYFPSQTDLDAVRSMLEGSGLVTLAGFGGVGKTRLAVEVAARSIGNYDTVLFVDLASIAEPHLVVSATATTMGIPVGNVLAIVRSLQTRNALVIFDNCEHLLDAVADLVTEIIARCATCRVIATSREPLGIDGERVWRVRSMEVVDAHALFEDRARALRPDAAIGPDEQRVIDEICGQLDCIPLAVELAAARIAHLSVHEIAAMLGERFQLLSGGHRRTRQRQQTMQATMDWSYGLLHLEEQAMLRCCAVFVDGFTREALAGVSGAGSASTLDILGSLVAKSLVLVDTGRHGSRYRLFETVRQYALERSIEAGDAGTLRQRHARWFADSLLETELVTYRDGTARSERERANLISVLDWLDEQGDLAELGRVAARMIISFPIYVWVDDTHHYLGRADVEAALQGEDLAAYALANAHNANAMGEFAEQSNEARRAYELASPGSILRMFAGQYYVNALAVMDPETGIAVADELLSELTPTTEVGKPWILYGKADCYITSGRLEEGVRLNYELRDLAEGRVVARADFALILHVVGRDDEARKELEYTPAEWRMDPHHQRVGRALLSAAAGDHDAARAALVEAAQAARRAPMRLLDRDILIAAAALAFRRGDAHRASVLLGVERDSLFARSPGSWVTYQHYRNLVRETLTREELETCKREARDLTIAQALADELGDAWAPTDQS